MGTSVDASVAGDSSAAYDLNQQSIEYGNVADEAWDTGMGSGYDDPV